MTFYTLPMLICFAILSATVFMLTVELYKILSPGWVNRKALIRKVEALIAQETDRLHDPNVYPSIKQQATNRINVLIYINEIIKSL